MRNKYIVNISWESEDIEIEANTKEEAIEKAKSRCNSSPNIDDAIIISAKSNIRNSENNSEEKR